MVTFLNQPELLPAIVTLGRSRAIAAGVDSCEYDSVTAGLTSVSQWPAAFRTAGAAHRGRAERAEHDGNRITAADAYLAAAACCHIATTVPTTDLDGHTEAADAMARALAILEPETRELAGPTFRATLIPQPADPTAALVVIIPGLDSSRVEFHANAVALRRRGLATLTIDGPGQGVLAPATTLRHDYHTVVTAALDVTLASGSRPRAIGLMALSLGGYYGALALAREPRLTAGVTVSGPSTLTWDELPELLRAILTIRAGDPDSAATFTRHIDVRPFAADIRQPLLIVDGANDVIPGCTNGHQLAQLAPHAQHLLIPHGDHLVGNRRWEWVPRAADFLQHQLGH